MSTTNVQESNEARQGVRCPFDHTARCDTCHHVAPVHLNRIWAGGHGYQSEYRCCCEAACAARRGSEA